jgi:hypothetical protein
VRNFFFGFLLILAAILVTHTARTSHGESRNTTTRTITADFPTLPDCTISINSPHPDNAVKSVVGGVRYSCGTAGVDSLTTTVALQKRAANGSWATVASQKFLATGAATARGRSNAARTKEVAVPCAPGTYRTEVSTTSTKGGKTHDYGTKDSRTAANPCAR